MARFVHQQSLRKEAPFMTVNCGAIPENLMESEFFGHVKGAFTGAHENKKGYFALCNGGTLFLDEIGELPLSLQVKLLRILQSKQVTPLGSTKEEPADVRIISATHADLQRKIQEGFFREDLFFRINLITLELPPLRARGHDILLLAGYFLEKWQAEFGMKGVTLSRRAQMELLRFAWPGNIRQLQNVIQKALIQAENQNIQPEHLGLGLTQQQAPRLSLREAKEQAEKQVIERALKESSGNLTQAAAWLGIDRKVLREHMERLCLEKDDYKL
jgi:transcriptional regulator with PAS, ATPase and Fis domain